MRSDMPQPAEVPPILQGAWRRAWIRTADGAVDDTTTVIWLQLASEMVDVRIGADQPAIGARGSFVACSLEELNVLAASESSSGHTTCTPIETDADGLRSATAEWFTRAPGTIAFQPVTAYPEPGLLDWNDDATIMTERAPSGAYVEQWHSIAGSDAPAEHRMLGDGRHWYQCGDIGVLVRDRQTPIARPARLDELIAGLGDDHAAITALIDCEFSIAERRDEAFVITASTIPWRRGDLVDVDVDL